MKTNIKYTLALSTILFSLVLSTTALADSEKITSAKGITGVQVNTIQDVEVTVWNKSTVKIGCHEGDINSEKLEVKSTAGWIHIKDMEPICEKISISMPATFKLKVTVISGNVSVKGLKNGLKIGTVSGNIRVEDTEGALDVESVSGQITVLRTKGDLTGKTVSGGIDIHKVDAEHLTAKSVSGEVIVESVTSGSVRLVSHSGEVNYLGKLPKTELSAKTFSGELVIEIPDTDGFDISAETASGEIEVEHKIQASTLSDHRITGQYKQGGADLTLRSFSGEISLKISR